MYVLDTEMSPAQDSSSSLFIHELQSALSTIMAPLAALLPIRELMSQQGKCSHGIDWSYYTLEVVGLLKGGMATEDSLVVLIRRTF